MELKLIGGLATVALVGDIGMGSSWEPAVSNPGPSTPVTLQDGIAAELLLAKAINNGPLAKNWHLNVQKIGESVELDRDANDKLKCQSLVYTNAGKLSAVWTVEWLDQKREEVWLEVATLN